MNESLSSVTRLAALALLALALIGCSAGGSGGTPAPTVGTTTPTATPVGGAPTDAQSVCLAMSEPLLLAALAESVSEPEYGDIAGGDGVYCYFTVAGDADTNVEAQVDNMTQLEFNDLAETLGADAPYAGVGRSAFIKEGSVEGVPGSTVMGWDEGLTVIIDLARDGDQAEMDAAAKALAIKLLTDLK